MSQTQLFAGFNPSDYNQKIAVQIESHKTEPNFFCIGRKGEDSCILSGESKFELTNKLTRLSSDANRISEPAMNTIKSIGASNE